MNGTRTSTEAWHLYVAKLNLWQDGRCDAQTVLAAFNGWLTTFVADRHSRAAILDDAHRRMTTETTRRSA
jgi:hypothetical protein